MRRVYNHPILDELPDKEKVTIFVDGKEYKAFEGEMLAAALLANGITTFRYTAKKNKPRGLFCAIGKCTDCIMTVDGHPNVRTCITKVHDGMRVETQIGTGSWSKEQKGR